MHTDPHPPNKFGTLDYSQIADHPNCTEQVLLHRPQRAPQVHGLRLVHRPHRAPLVHLRLLHLVHIVSVLNASGVLMTPLGYLVMCLSIPFLDVIFAIADLLFLALFGSEIMTCALCQRDLCSSEFRGTTPEIAIWRRHEIVGLSGA